jgi:hypothetical protein
MSKEELLQQKVNEIQKRNDTVIPRAPNGRVLWSRLPEEEEARKKMIEAEARSLMAGGFDFSTESFKSQKLTSLQHGFSAYYPGGMPALRTVLEVGKKRPNGYWTVERIETAAKALVQRHGD